MKRLFLSMGIALFLVVLFGYANDVNGQLSNDFLRIHFLANSDSEQDQEIKLKVRDAVLKTAEGLIPKNASKEQATQTLLLHQDLILNSARKVLVQENCSDPVALSYGKQFFPKKSYGGLKLPSGEYEAFRVKIGQAQGHNWWCVLYPAFSGPAEELEEDEKILLKQRLTEEEWALVTSNQPSVELRFKTVDYIMKLKEKIKKMESEL